MATSHEIINELRNFQTNGSPAAIEIARQVGFTVPVMPHVEYFAIDEYLDGHEGLVVSAVPSRLDHHAISRDCSVIENACASIDETTKKPLSLWMRDVIELAEINISDRAQKLLVDNTGAIIRHRIDLIYSRFEAVNG